MPGLHICRSVLNPHHEATIENRFFFEHVTCWIVVPRATMTVWHCFSWAIHQQLQQAPGPRQHIRVGARRGTLQRCSTLPWLMISDYLLLLIINRWMMLDHKGHTNACCTYTLMRKTNGVAAQGGRRQECLCESVLLIPFSGVETTSACAQPHSFYGKVASHGGWCGQFESSFGGWTYANPLQRMIGSANYINTKYTIDFATVRASPSHWQACGKLPIGTTSCGDVDPLQPYPTTPQSKFSRVPLSRGTATHKQVQSRVDFLAPSSQPWPISQTLNEKHLALPDAWCYLA